MKPNLRIDPIWAGVMGIILCLSGLTACGFQLRSADNTQLQILQKTPTQLVGSDDKTTFLLKKATSQYLQRFSIPMVESAPKFGYPTPEAERNAEPFIKNRIEIANVRFKKYELVGVLTEIRLVLSADVRYQLWQNHNQGWQTITNPIQVERSYQYNEASVSVEDMQNQQIRTWLYDTMAQQISEQLIALRQAQSAPNHPAIQSGNRP